MKTELITTDYVKKCLPKGKNISIDDNFTKKLKTLTEDVETASVIRDNFFTYTSVLKDGKFSADDYLSAIKYVTFKLMGENNRNSYIRTFPDRYARIVELDKNVDNYAKAYNSTKLVNNILEQALIPSWLLNQDSYQKAINVQLELMQNAKSDMVRHKAADSIMNHLKRPEAQTVELNLGDTETNTINQLQETLTKLASQQKELINSGLDTKSIAEQNIIDVTPAKDN
jgi:hypothetical protein